MTSPHTWSVVQHNYTMCRRSYVHLGWRSVYKSKEIRRDGTTSCPTDGRAFDVKPYFITKFEVHPTIKARAAQNVYQNLTKSGWVKLTIKLLTKPKTELCIFSCHAICVNPYSLFCKALKHTCLPLRWETNPATDVVCLICSKVTSPLIFDTL